METDLTYIQMRAFITAASLLVDSVLASSNLSDEQLFEVERWLAAHLACSREKITTSESMGGASDAYAVQIGLGLNGSFYGQQVKLLDTTGKLAALDERKKRASLEWLGHK
jgi:hypothetical protein